MYAFQLLADSLLTRLVWTSAQAVVLIGIVWLIARWLPRISSALRCALWWLVGLQLVLGLCWATPLQLPLLTPAAQTTMTVERLPPIADLPAGPSLTPSAIAITSPTTDPPTDGFARRQREAFAKQRSALSGQRERAAKMAEEKAHVVMVDALKQGKFQRLD